MVKLSKEESLKKIDLRKNKIVSLTKQNGVLDGKKARVALVVDFSWSMSDLFKSGTVQSIIERIIPLALHFDDNGELNFWIFENGFKRLDGITLNNFYGMADEVYSRYNMGGTKYAPVMEDIISKYISEEPAELPEYVLFITDGDNSDKAKAESVIVNCAKYPIFWMFIGVGSERFEFLTKLDDMEGRYVDNADFFKVNDINAMSDDDLYARMFEEFPSWLANDKVTDMIKNYRSLPSLDSLIQKSDGGKKKGFFSRIFG